MLRQSPRVVTVETPVSHDTEAQDRAFTWLLTGREGYGVIQTIINLSNSLRQRGLPVQIYTIGQGRGLEQIRQTQLPIRCLNIEEPLRFQGNLLQRGYAVAFNNYRRRSQVAQLRKAIGIETPRTIHCTAPHLIGLVGAAARHYKAIPLWEVTQVTGVNDRLGLGRRIYGRLCRKFRIVVLPNSHATAATLDLRAIRSVVNYACVDADRFDPSVVRSIGRKELTIDNDRVVATIVARLEPLKGQAMVLQAVKSINQMGYGMTLLLVGGPIESEFVDRLRSIAKSDPKMLHIVGPVNRPERYYGVTDFAISAYKGQEGFGLSVVEAMLMRRPALVHSLGGPGETVLDGVTGWHVSKATTESFVEGIRRALLDRSRWIEMGEAARQRASENFGCQVTADRYLRTIYQEEDDR